MGLHEGDEQRLTLDVSCNTPLPQRYGARRCRGPASHDQLLAWANLTISSSDGR
jgi:hypothetical protein